MVNVQADVVVMAIIPEDFNLSRTSIIDAAGYLVDQRMAIFLDSPLREVLRKIHLMQVVKGISFRFLFPPQLVMPLLTSGQIPESYRYIQQFKETATRHGLECVIVLLPRMEANAWGPLLHRLTQERIKYLALTFLRKEFTREEYMASRYDRHASFAVHRRIGESLADYLLPILELLP